MTFTDVFFFTFRSVGNTDGSPGTGDGDYRPRTAYRGERSERGTYRGSGERGGGRGRGGMRNARGGAGMQDNRGKRDFDRQSGSDKSGVKPIEKRDGSGAHNWGSVQDEIEGQLEPSVVEEVAEGDADAAAVDGTEAKYVFFSLDLINFVHIWTLVLLFFCFSWGNVDRFNPKLDELVFETLFRFINSNLTFSGRFCGVLSLKIE